MLQSGHTSAALSAFQKFTDEMVAKHAQQPPDDNTKAAIQTVINYMDTLFSYLVDWHNVDKERADKCEEHIQRCQDDHLSKSTTSFINQFYVKVNQSRYEHLLCRTECEATCVSTNQACQAYDAYRLTTPAQLPDCVEAPRFDLRDEYVSTIDSEILPTMESCLNETKNWHKPLYDLYKACSRGPDSNCSQCQEECKREQGEFEVEHCQWSTIRVDHCHAHEICWNHSVEECDTDCKQIQQNVEARKAQNETGERIECLLHVLLADNESKAGNLSACKAKEYNTSFFNLSCHQGDSVWPLTYPVSELPISCDTTEVPCTDDFIVAEYSDVNEDTCKVCDSLTTHFYFVRDGQCGGVAALSSVYKKSIGACAAACHAEASCNLFSWAAFEEGGNNCILFPASCSETEGNSQYITYSLNPNHACAWATPHSVKFDHVLCEDGAFVPTSSGCGDLESIQCPINRPFMCADKSCSADSGCDGMGGPRACEASVPEPDIKSRPTAKGQTPDFGA